MDKDIHLFRLLTNLEIDVRKEDGKKSLYQDLIGRKLIYPMEEDLAYYAVTEKDTRILQAFSKICKAMAALSLPELGKGIRLAADCLFREQNLNYEPVLEGLDELIKEKGMKSAARFLTAHDAKGQQFQAVFVYGIDLFESGDAEEDRRLLYVAMTRAEKCLITSEQLKGKSNFLRDFIDHVIVWR